MLGLGRAAVPSDRANFLRSVELRYRKRAEILANAVKPQAPVAPGRVPSFSQSLLAL